jgi:glycosyltransferase involved in cell wall biosynthesis
VLLAELARRGHACTLVTLADEPDFHALPPGIERVRLAGPGASRSVAAAIRNNVGAVRMLARALEELRPDVVLAFGDTTNVKTLLAAARVGIPAVVSERIDPATVEIGRAWSLLRRVAYARAAAIVVQTERVRGWAEQHAHADRIHVIENPVELAPEPPDGPRDEELLAVGRLVPQKGFDALLPAFARIAERHPRWRLTILGDGPARDELAALARRLGVDDRVALPGRVPDVRARLRRAGAFVLSSRFEGFPNALLEAMAEGTAIVAMDCKSGPREMLRDCPEALLVPVDDVPALADALDRTLADEQHRRACGRSAHAAARRFDASTLVGRWEAVLAGAAAPAGKGSARRARAR